MAICIRREGQPPEWVMVEMQGQLQLEDESECFDGMELGKLAVDASGKPVLQVGHQVLIGAFMELKKPLAVLGSGGRQEEIHKGLPSLRYDVLGIIKRKAVFTKRPVPFSVMPVITK
eukprot:GDKI01025913.1.p1 GENE.GDKI01025913.1~~GDKI01025913.1.p1  ORF type:complete len:117 (-),score=29.63 GDKI01025913.1:31-381(-)